VGIGSEEWSRVRMDVEEEEKGGKGGKRKKEDGGEGE
jgi:hypothetical protein